MSSIAQPAKTEEERRAAKRERVRRWREANPEKARAGNRAWRARNAEQLRTYRQTDEYKADARARRKATYKKNPQLLIARTKAWCLKNPELVQKNKLKHSLLRRYGISVEQFDEMLKRSPVCAGCLTPFDKNKRPCVDHHHTTKKVRGLLCRTCNFAVGHAHDSADTLMRLGQYLLKMETSDG